jgi:hypothetical protein
MLEISEILTPRLSYGGAVFNSTVVKVKKAP